MKTRAAFNPILDHIVDPEKGRLTVRYPQRTDVSAAYTVKRHANYGGTFYEYISTFPLDDRLRPTTAYLDHPYADERRDSGFRHSFHHVTTLN